MNFTTQVPIKRHSGSLINYQSKCLFLGSCFVENIGGKLKDFQFNTAINPFGILFHPEAILGLVEKAVQGYTYTSKDVFENNEQFSSFYAHSQLNKSNENDVVEVLNTNSRFLLAYLKAASHVFITLGTAWGYYHNSIDSIVANCHKVPQKEFQKIVSSVQEVQDTLQKLIGLIKSVNPKAEVVLTVSPVRHLKDGFIENNRSKAHLLAAIHNVIEAHLTVSYFPAYEIVIDELRDYRFYKEDLLHPNNVAINYIWEKFKMAFIDQEAEATMKRVAKLNAGLSHKPFNPTSKAHLNFLEKLETEKAALLKAFPFMKF